jgi:hypothetical protein
LSRRLRPTRLLVAVSIVAVSLVAVAPHVRTTLAGASTTTTTTTPSKPTVPAYWLVATDGGIFSFGGAGYYGSTGNIVLNKPIVGMAPSHDGLGYWMVASDGGIFSFGDTKFYGSTGSIKLNKPIVGMSPTPDGLGYWLVATDGGIFSFGDAAFFGSTGSIKLNQPVVGMAPTPTGLGYWLVAADGGIFSFGDAHFFGSTGSIKLNKPIINMIGDPNGGGYLLIASDGGTFSFGTAPFYGSLGGIPLKNPIVAAAVTPAVTGYWFVDAVGVVSAFGKATYFGSAPSPLNKPIVGMAEGPGSGNFAGGPYPSGTYGYDISNFQCNSFPTGNHTIGIVQVDGLANGATNPCLTQEAQWAGGGLNLYVFLSYGTQATGPGYCLGDTSCNWGYAAGLHAYQDAVNAGVNVNVGWWLDVEKFNWSSSTAENMQVVQGALAALHNQEGIANVGIYASPGSWNGIVGNYQPSVPFWMADWLIPPSGPNSCADIAKWNATAKLPTGPLEVVQFGSPSTDPTTAYDEDYAC